MKSKQADGRSANIVHNDKDHAFERMKVEFPSCNVMLRGLLLVPVKREGTLPGIVMAPGMSGVKEGSIYKYAEFFARGGFVVLAYDNINFGESEGEPRQEADPVLQRRGYRDAITFLSLRPEVDGGRIGIWGTSYSGGHVLEVAAHDRRVKCVVSQSGFSSGFQNFLRRVQPQQRNEVLAAQDADREARFLGQKPATIKAVSDDPAEPCAMPGQAAYSYFMDQAKQAPNWKNELTLRSLDLLRGLENGAFTPYIMPTPLLMILSLDDELVPPDLSLRAYEAALQPKKLVLVPGNHFVPYAEEFGLTSNSARDWFTRHLMVGGSVGLN
ncbi:MULTISPECIES: alpha/beta hydrolase [unclassified Bradyrhizobium]|uniref:alpha/beta hydrolase n=1 Tax=unclassified Bradyrhizobium TaxID=2631580 RepID=UPI00247A4A9B|nr:MULTISPECIES: alpha/beta hydrolase [unclassified Bradyrhizobium]WGS19209.1 alpha/beta hydrolase [Bradyrhizobium sp. ISRA463]WGS26046.1 alpha/beta hydrolase [Bradyrhizobium sp. ISRA464]